jgi:hypothetical protein
LRKAYIFLAFVLVFLAPTISARAESQGPKPLVEMRDALLAFFTPIEGEIKTVDGSAITASMSTKDQLRAGMRFKIVRKGTPFVHPVTKEPLGSLEETIGVAQVTETGPGDVSLKVLSGTPAPGDIVRISKAKVRLLFYQMQKVSWGLADEYFRLLKESNRFELLSTGEDKEELAMSEGKRLNADVVLVLSQPGGTATDKGTTLNQKLLWTLDSTEFLSSGALIDAASLKELTLGEEIFAAKERQAVNFKVPYRAELLALGDIDGDGARELLIGVEKKIYFYSIKSAVLEPAVSGLELKPKKGDELLRIETLDVNADGRDEVIAVTKEDKNVYSSVYFYKDGKFREVHKDRLFLRPIAGKLYGQDFDPAEGFKGDIRAFSVQGDKLVEDRQDDLTKSKKIPAGVDIYAFSFMNTGGKEGILAFDKDSFLNFYDSAGVLVWRSDGDFGGFPKKYKKEAPSVIVDKGYWSVKDKIYVVGPDAFVIKRTPVAGIAKGLGFKASSIKVLKWNGLSMEMADFTEEVSGGIYDLAMDGEKLLMLSSPMMGLEIKKVLQGESPFSKYLSLYPLGGM